MRVVLEGGEREFLLEGPPLARGGEATVYPVPGEPELAAKVYHHPTPDNADKLAALLAVRPPDAGRDRVSVAWPIARLLAAESGDVVGCLMPRVVNARRVCELFNPRARNRVCPLFHFGYLLRTARNLAAAVGELHERSLVVGDLNESNVLVSTRAFVTLVDADSFQIASPGGVCRCRVGSAEYTPPELQGMTFADFDRCPEHDAFALAVLIFQLMMQGVHPFAGRFSGAGEPDSLPDRIRAGYWPYALERDGPFQPVPHAPPWEVLPPSVGELFLRCFEEGHAAPERRPSAREWRQALDTAELVPCPASPQHHYPRGLDQCPWCILARQQDCDPFPTLEQICEARRRSLSLADTSATAWGPATADSVSGLDPTDPLPPSAAAELAPAVPASEPEMHLAAVAPARSPSWSSWLAVAATSALIGVVLVLCRHRPAPPAQAAHAAPPATDAKVTPARPVQGPQATVARPEQPSAGQKAVARKAEQAWQDAVADLQQAQRYYQTLLQDFEAKRAAAPPGKVNARILVAHQRLRAQHRVVEEKARIVREKAQQWQEALAAVLRKGGD